MVPFIVFLLALVYYQKFRQNVLKKRERKREKGAGRMRRLTANVSLLRTYTTVYRHHRLASQNVRYLKMRRLVIDNFKWISYLISEAITISTEK